MKDPMLIPVNQVFQMLICMGTSCENELLKLRSLKSDFYIQLKSNFFFDWYLLIFL